MVNLTFGEQVKIILSRKGMTIKQLAELVESHTGKPMSRQNMTQRLGRDNFQEQDMRLIAEILGCRFQLSIMEMETEEEQVLEHKSVKEMPEVEIQTTETQAADELDSLEREITVGELVDIAEEYEAPEMPGEAQEESSVEVVDSTEALDAGKMEETLEAQERELLKKGVRGYFKKAGNMVASKRDDSEEKPSKGDKPSEDVSVVGDINPYTGKEYKSNSVRMHPKRIGYVQVYDQEQHKWTDMTEWAFLGYQERKKVLLGKDYEPPIYLD